MTLCREPYKLLLQTCETKCRKLKQDGVILWMMEKKMETTVVYWACCRIMERRMETTLRVTEL